MSPSFMMAALVRCRYFAANISPRRRTGNDFATWLMLWTPQAGPSRPSHAVLRHIASQRRGSRCACLLSRCKTATVAIGQREGGGGGQFCDLNPARRAAMLRRLVHFPNLDDRGGEFLDWKRRQ